MSKINLVAIKRRAKRATKRGEPGGTLTNDNDLREYAVKMLGPRNHWPSITDYAYACLVNQFCMAASEAVAVQASDTLAVLAELRAQEVRL